MTKILGKGPISVTNNVNNENYVVAGRFSIK